MYRYVSLTVHAFKVDKLLTYLLSTWMLQISMHTSYPSLTLELRYEILKPLYTSFCKTIQLLVSLLSFFFGRRPTEPAMANEQRDRVYVHSHFVTINVDALLNKISQIFALVIGIDQYMFPGVQNLEGAVADAESVRNFLSNSTSLSTPDHITLLLNERATRSAILDALKSLATDPTIRQGDPILIYYAGHGSSKPPPAEWNDGDESAVIE